MELWEFVQKYNKEKIDFDKAFGYQCVDLFRQYCTDVLQVPHTGSVEGAKDLYLKYDKLPLECQYFRRIKGVSGIKPGDVVIWDKSETNKYGHVAIYLAKEGNKLIVLEQNGYTQDGTKISSKDNLNILGYLRFRK